MREYGIEPVLPGYCGMVPHNAKGEIRIGMLLIKILVQLSSSCLLQPEDERFEENLCFVL